MDRFWKIGSGTRRFPDFACLRLCGWVCIVVAAAISMSFGCAEMPSLEVQEYHVRANKLLLHELTPPAFVRAWGPPTYQHAEFMQFFVMKDDSYIPRSRLAIGEPPRGWEVRIEAGDGLFLAYPEHGWLVVFFEERLVYREALTSAELHALGRNWQHEDKFRTRLEVPGAQ
ncbi:MAG: hypothetical protein OEV08_15790 [Nitrospira sp.]|nr:hypothetical protein [Nitrospira sp.]